MEAKRPPPRVNKGVQALADLHTPDRFDRLVLGGQLWCSSCQSSGSDGGSSVTSVAAPQPIPETFASVAEYVSAFEPYVLEEARESLRAEWAEQRDKSSGSCWAVEVASHEERPGGWLVVRVRASDRHGELKQRCAPGAVAVLSWARPPSKGAADWAAQLGERLGGWKPDEQAVGQDSASALAAASAPKRPRLEPTPPPHACAIAAGISRRTKERELELHFHPACPGHGARSCPSAGALSAALRGGHRAWWVSLAGVLVSSRREHEALLRVGELDPALRRSLLRPARLAELGRPFEDAEVRRRQWPSGARQPAFVARLQAQCDYTQLEAIEMAACHLGRDQTEGSLPHLPFILIQGPPGTGKTHTIVGVLNVWHLVAYQEYYHSLLQAMQGGGGTREAPLAERDDSRRGRRGERDREALPAANPHDILEHALQDPFFSRLSAAALRERPRLLVCAPSNAACDELARRVMRDGFRDGGGAAYAPNLVRVGAEGESAVAEAIRPRSIGFLVEQVAGLSQAEWQQRSQMASAKDTRLAQEIALLQRALAGGAAGEVVEDDGARTKETRRARPIDRASAGRVPVEQPDVAAPASSSDPDEALARRLIDLLQQQHRISHERRRLEAARALVWGAREEWQRRQAEREIETSFLSEAEMVFATLSSTQRRVFQEVVRTAPFATALVDEAGQASEVAALQALVCGASRAVLVGDPQQLPATVLSEAGRAALAGRSLFERLQAQGAPVKMLSVQYRMHPAIRAFPGGHFYGGRLRDAPSVVALADECFYAHPLLKPYVFFDVSRGREARGGSGGSLGNAAEAELAAALFAELRAWVTRAARERPGSVGAVSVGVITPYRQQRTLLRETFARMLSPAVAAEAAIETVDSFQGRQLDVVILSCVRAGEERGLGFVSDVRRLNVAITRARRALWILGSRARLRRGREWGALIQDAEERRCVVEDADARELFPAWEYWTKGADADGEQRKSTPAQPPGS